MNELVGWEISILFRQASKFNSYSSFANLKNEFHFTSRGTKHWVGRQAIISGSISKLKN